MRLFPLRAASRPLLAASLTVFGTMAAIAATYLGGTSVLELTMGWTLSRTVIVLCVFGARPTLALLARHIRANGLSTLREYVTLVLAWPAFYVFVIGATTGLYQITLAALPNTYGRSLVSTIAVGAATLLVAAVLVLAAFFAQSRPSLIVRGTPLGTIASVSAHLHLHFSERPRL